MVQDGEQENKGFEWAFTGKLAKKWDLIGGAMYLKAEDYKGNKINGASKWSGTVGAIYHPTDELSFIGRMTYLGLQLLINNGALDVPSYAKYDLGASYKTKLNNTPVTFTMCYNIAGKDYWSACSGSSGLCLGRTAY